MGVTSTDPRRKGKGARQQQTVYNQTKCKHTPATPCSRAHEVHHSFPPSRASANASSYIDTTRKKTVHIALPTLFPLPTLSFLLTSPPFPDASLSNRSL